MSTIVLRTLTDDGRVPVSAYLAPRTARTLSIHGSRGYWVVSHVQSGYAVCTFCTKREAQRFAVSFYRHLGPTGQSIAQLASFPEWVTSNTRRACAARDAAHVYATGELPRERVRQEAHARLEAANNV
jgi:hypothetical protein